MILLAIRFPSADLEAGFGMFAVPLLLFFLSPKIAATTEPVGAQQRVVESSPPEDGVGGHISRRRRKTSEDKPPAVVESSPPEAVQELSARPKADGEDREHESSPPETELGEGREERKSEARKRRSMQWAEVEEDDQDFVKHLQDTAAEGRPRPKAEREVPAEHGKERKRPPRRDARRSEDAQKELAHVRSLARAGDISGALAAVEKAMEAGVPQTQLQNALLDALINGGDLDLAGELFDQMRSSGQADVVSFNIMLRGRLQAGDASELLKDMREAGFATNKVTFNELLSDRVRAKDRDGMWRIVDDMQAAGVGMNRIACTILLRAVQDHNDIKGIERTFNLLENLDEPSDEVLRSSAIEACLRVAPDRLNALLEKLGDRGQARPGASPATYGSMIKAHGRARDLERIWETWREMSRGGVKPTAVTIGCMVEALVQNGAVAEAWTLVQDLIMDEQLQSSVNTVVYSTVLKGFAHAKQPRRCFAVLDEMSSRGIERNTITYNTLLNACAECGVMDRVPQVFSEMTKSGAEPDMITYSTLVKGFCKVGDLDRAIDLLKDIKSDSNLKLDEIVYNSLLDGCARQQEPDKALKLLDDMLASGVAPSNYTLSILVKLLGRAKRLKQTFAMVEELKKKHGVQPNVQVYTCLAHACFLNRQLDRALSVHDTMVADLQESPDQKAYSVLLSGCLQAGAPDEALRVARCAYRLPGHGLAEPDASTAPVGVEARLLSDLSQQVQRRPDLKQSFEELAQAAGVKIDRRSRNDKHSDRKRHGWNWVQ